MKKLILILSLFIISLCGSVYAADCQKSIETIFGHEGGYQCLRSDSGNWTGGNVGKGQLKGTKYGISAASYPKLNIRGLTLSDAAKIYRRDYWEPLHLTDMKSQGLATTILDTAVNCGTGTAADVVNQSVSLLSGKWPLPVDHTLSNADINWINQYTKPKHQRVTFYLVFQGIRSDRYAHMAQHNKSKARFLPTWLLRTWGKD